MLLAERIKKVVSSVVGEVQNGFIKDRFILDGILVANESFEDLKKRKRKA